MFAIVEQEKSTLFKGTVTLEMYSNRDNYTTGIYCRLCYLFKPFVNKFIVVILQSLHVFGY